MLLNKSPRRAFIVYKQEYILMEYTFSVDGSVRNLHVNLSGSIEMHYDVYT